MDKPPEETFNLKQFRLAASDTTIIRTMEVSRPATPEAYLVHIHPSGPDLGKRTPVGAIPVVIGRDSACSLPNAHGSVSRRHARVETLPNGTHQVTDLNSTNGTFVNNVRVRTGPVNDGDYLRVGECLYRFLAGGNVEAEYHEEIHRLSIIDPLTGVHNRRSLNEFLDRELERAKRHARPLSVVLFDIDHFKRINDQFGHTAGDFTLRDVAARTKELTRQDELLARYGGEEFALVLPETGLERALATAERFRRAVCAAPFAFEGKPFPVTVSAGVGVLPAGGQTSAADLLRRADECLYEAKRAGRNCVAPMARVGRPPTPAPQNSDDVDTVQSGPKLSGVKS